MQIPNLWNNAGIIAALSLGDVEISHCTVKGTITTAVDNGTWSVAAIIGRCDQLEEPSSHIQVTISDCLVDITMEVSGAYCGGIIGQLSGYIDLTITDCTVNMDHSTIGTGGDTGGLLGSTFA